MSEWIAVLLHAKYVSTYRHYITWYLGSSHSSGSLEIDSL